VTTVLWNRAYFYHSVILVDKVVVLEQTGQPDAGTLRSVARLVD